MAIPTTSFLGFLRPLNLSRYLLPSSSTSFFFRRFSTDLLGLPSTSLPEGFVLEELSDLLSLDRNPPNPLPFTEQSPHEPRRPTPVRDLVLLPDEKLRGLFLQRLPGRSALESALSNAGIDLTAEVFASVLNKGSLGGGAMVSFFDWAVKQPKLSTCVETYNAMLKALGRRKFFTYMDEILLRMRNDEVKPNPETLEIMMDSYIRARQINKALNFFEKLEEIGALGNLESLNVLLRCLCRRSHVGVASSLLTTMKEKMDLDNATYNAVISGWAKFGRVDKVEGYWTMMKNDGLSPDNNTFCYIIEALGRAGRIADAMDVFEKMGCHRDTMTYNTMMVNLVLLGDLERSLVYYKEMCGKSSSPDVETYNILICALLKVRRVADALELFDEMLNRGVLPSTGMVTSFLEPLCSFGPPHAAMIIYKKSRKAGCCLSKKAYKLLLMRLSRFGKCQTVLKIWDEMHMNGHESDKETYEYIINGLCNVGQIDSAVLVMEESLQKGFCLGGIIYSKLNSKLLEMNKVETAYKLFLNVKHARVNANSQSYWRANGRWIDGLSLEALSDRCMMCQGPIFQSKYCYNHHYVKEPEVDIHNIIIKKSRSCVFLSYFGTAVFLTSTFYSLAIKEFCVSFLWISLLSVIFAESLQYRAIKKESVVIIPEFGIQLETHYWSGRIDHRFVPINMILKPVLNECVTPFTCYWCMALVIRGKDDHLMVFQKMQPPLKMLIPIWKALCNVTDHKVASQTKFITL